MDDIELLDWVNTTFTDDSYRRIEYDHFEYLAEHGTFDVIRWVHDRGYELPAKMLDIAAGMGNMPLLQFLHERGKPGCLNTAMGYAAQFDHLSTIKFLHENRTEANDSATCKHEFAVFQLQKRNQESCASYLPLIAARKGHLDIVEYAHEHDFGGFTPGVMSEAAVHGHLDIVKFLHVNRTEGCTTRGLEHGQPHVVEFLKLHGPMKESGGRLAPVLSFVKRRFGGERAALTTETNKFFDEPRTSIRRVEHDGLHNDMGMLG